MQQHLDPATVRAVILQDPAGLRRGTQAHATGAPIRVPVGRPVLGRLLDATGIPTDRVGPLPADIATQPIHAAAPGMDRLDASVEPFHTGIKVIDLLAPQERLQPRAFDLALGSCRSDVSRDVLPGNQSRLTSLLQEPKARARG